MDALSPQMLNGVGVVALVALLFVALMRGWLYVKPVYDAVVQDRDYWRDAFFKEQAAHSHTIAQNAELLEGPRLTQAALEGAVRAATGGA